MENQSGGLEGRVSEAETIRLLANLDAIGQILNRFHRDIVAYTKRKGLETDCYEAVKMYDSLPDNHPIRRQFKPE
ncbi:MAG TPA: hypothetical protein VJB90_05355, partial [Candidatus Nanoarchaeia archaeon]|nr:hypothetical protein [Candidatus Nanoarchaeia archaeon]